MIRNGSLMSDAKILQSLSERSLQELTTWSFMYILAVNGMNSSAGGTNCNAREVFSVIIEQCFQRAIELCGISYSHKWSRETRGKIRERVKQIMLGRIADVEGDAQFTDGVFDANSLGYSPVGCAHGANRSIFVENSGIHL